MESKPDDADDDDDDDDWDNMATMSEGGLSHCKAASKKTQEGAMGGS